MSLQCPHPHSNGNVQQNALHMKSANANHISSTSANGNHNQAQSNLVLQSLLLRQLQLLQNQTTGTNTNSTNGSNSISLPAAKETAQQNCCLSHKKIFNESAPIARNFDSLHNNLAPTVVLLPVAFHSLADQNHVQLVGMPQTVIPVALHPSMLANFPVRSLLIDSALAKGTISTMARNLPVLSTAADKDNNNDRHWHHFHLPVAFQSQSSIAFSPQPQQSNSNANRNTTNMDLLHSAENATFHPPNERNGSGEPLDLSLSSSTAAAASCETTTTLEQKAQQLLAMSNGRRTANVMVRNSKEYDGYAGSRETGPFRVPMPPPPSTGGRRRQTATDGAASATHSGHGHNKTLVLPCTSAAAPTASVATSPHTASDASRIENRKKYPCDFCGEVSFLAMETLEGHKNYYCPNRPQPLMPRTCAPPELAAPLPFVAPKSACNKITVSTSQCDGSVGHGAPSQQQMPAPFTCLLCGFKSTNARALRTHQRLAHHECFSQAPQLHFGTAMLAPAANYQHQERDGHSGPAATTAGDTLASGRKRARTQNHQQQQGQRRQTLEKMARHE